jgi:choline dehydrogenase
MDRAIAASYDYVIVGAGSAGCVLANRLSEDPAVTLLVLEAGGKATGLFKDMPIAFPRYVLRRDLNWNFQSEPEPFCNDRIIEIPRGKVLGGSSTINGMVYARGHRLDYDDWAQRGLTGWSYADVLPYFRRSEKSWAGGAYHGASGELEIAIPKTGQMQAELRQAAQNAGYPVTEDYHGRDSEGVSPSEMTIGGGRRGSTWRVFLQPALSRTNLTVASNTHTTRILFEDKRAVGIEYLHGGERKTARAKREVILCAGSYGSPQLLMLSGIGPAAQLAGHGIEPLVDLPGVGRNLIEHPFLFVGWSARPGSFRCELRVDRATLSVLRWALFGTGPFATNGLAGHVFLRTDPRLDRPDMQLTCIAVGMSARDVWYPIVGKRPVHMIGCGLSMIKQDSRGMVMLRSADPLDPPRIRFNLFEERSDVDRMIGGIRSARRVYNADPLRGMQTGELVPGEAVQSDAALEAFIRADGAITQHPVGTCKMGIKHDLGAVVDAQLKVYGVNGLRVIDASIMPDVPGGNTNAPAIMIAEKGADLIRGRSLPRAELGEAA